MANDYGTFNKINIKFHQKSLVKTEREDRIEGGDVERGKLAIGTD